MRSPYYFLLAVSSLAVVAASAQTTPYPSSPASDGTPISTVQVNAPLPTVRMRDDQVRQLAGSYAMSNGWMLKVRPSSRYIDATIDRQKPLRLLALSPDKFVTADGNVTMEFNRGDFGDEMVMSYIPDVRLGQVVTISSTLAQR